MYPTIVTNYGGRIRMYLRVGGHGVEHVEAHVPRRTLAGQVNNNVVSNVAKEPPVVHEVCVEEPVQ